MKPALKFACLVLCSLMTLESAASWDPYSVLDVERQADIVTVKRAYKRLAKEWHPDKNTSPQAEEKFVEINKAYEVLSDPERRQRYDRTGQTENTPNFGHRGGGGGPFDAFEREFGGFGGGGGQFRFSFQRHGTMLFHKQAITLRHYENKILPSSRTAPTLLLAFSEWCFGCVQMEPVWASLSEQLQDVGIGVATVHAERERELARRLAVDALPAVYLVVDGRALRYRRDSVSFASITEFVKAKLWPGLLTPLTPSGLPAFLSGWADNRVRLIIYSQRQTARLRYLALAFRFRGSAAAGFVYTGAPEQEPLLTAYGVPARAETLLVLKEDADVVAGRVSMDQLPFRVMVDVMEENRFLSLPRLSSQPVLESLCPMESAASRRRLCAVLVCGSGDPRPELQASLRQFLTTSALSGGRLQYAYIYMDKQARFMEPLLKEAAPADPLGHLLILWRRDHGRVRYLWSEQRWERSAERANETGRALERRLGALLTDDRLLQHEARVQELVDEHAHHLLRRILNKVYHLWETIWEQLSREEVLPALSVVVTIIFLIAGGYLMAYLVRMEEATIQSRYRAQGRPPPSRTTDTPQLRVHEMRVETYNGLVRLLKPGCRTIVLLLDADSKSRLSARFHRIVWPYRKNKSLMFAFVMLERGLEWYRRLLIPSLPDHQQTLNINPKNCIGTVLSINGYRKYFCMYHAKHAETGGKGGVRRRRTAVKGGATGGGEFMGFDSSNDSNSDLETGDKKKARRAAASDEVLFEEHLLDGLPDWLERLFEGQTVRYHVKYWPDFTGK